MTQYMELETVVTTDSEGMVTKVVANVMGSDVGITALVINILNKKDYED